MWRQSCSPRYHQIDCVHIVYTVYSYYFGTKFQRSPPTGTALTTQYNFSGSAVVAVRLTWRLTGSRGLQLHQLELPIPLVERLYYAAFRLPWSRSHRSHGPEKFPRVHISTWLTDCQRASPIPLVNFEQPVLKVQEQTRA